MAHGTEVGLDTGHIVLDGAQLSFPKRGQSPPFLAHVYCGQTAGWIKMPLGMEIGLGPGDIVLDGDPVPPKKEAQPPPQPIFGPCLLWPNGCMYQDITWYSGRPQSRRHCVRWGPSSPSHKGTQPPRLSSCFGIHGSVLNWFKSYLSSHFLHIKM